MRAVMSGASVKCAAAQERLEEARRLVDPQLHVDRLAVADLDEHRALALDAGEVVGAQRLASYSWAVLASSNAGAFALNVRKTRTSAGSLIPSTRSRFESDTVFGVSIGPEAAVAAARVGRADRAAAGLRDRPEARRAVRDHDAGRPAALALHADASSPARSAGARAGSAVTTSSSWRLSIGQPRSSKSTGTWSAIGVDVASVEMYSGEA